MAISEIAKVSGGMFCGKGMIGRKEVEAFLVCVMASWPSERLSLIYMMPILSYETSMMLIWRFSYGPGKSTLNACKLVTKFMGKYIAPCLNQYVLILVRK